MRSFLLVNVYQILPTFAMKQGTHIVIVNNSDSLAQEGAGLFVDAANRNVTQKGFFTVALSGGTTPRSMHQLLAEKFYSTQIPWAQTHIFWVDERCVSMNNSYSNYGMARQDLISKIPIPESHVHPMPAELPPALGAQEYQDMITAFFGLKQGQFPRFDLIILGIGKDGHTASLFPGHPGLTEIQRLVISVKGGDPDVNRLTMTFPVLNNAREILFLVSGEQKAETLRMILDDNRCTFPAQRICPVNGKLKWLIDEKAASLLNKP